MTQKAVEVSSVNSFKSHLEKIRHTQMDFSWTTSPLNPLAAGAGTLFDSVLNSGRSSSGAAR